MAGCGMYFLNSFRQTNNPVQFKLISTSTISWVVQRTCFLFFFKCITEQWFSKRVKEQFILSAGQGRNTTIMNIRDENDNIKQAFSCSNSQTPTLIFVYYYFYYLAFWILHTSMNDMGNENRSETLARYGVDWQKKLWNVWSFCKWKYE